MGSSKRTCNLKYAVDNKSGFGLCLYTSIRTSDARWVCWCQFVAQQSGSIESRRSGLRLVWCLTERSRTVNRINQSHKWKGASDVSSCVARGNNSIAYLSGAGEREASVGYKWIDHGRTLEIVKVDGVRRPRR